MVDIIAMEYDLLLCFGPKCRFVLLKMKNGEQIKLLLVILDSFPPSTVVWLRKIDWNTFSMYRNESEWMSEWEKALLSKFVYVLNLNMISPDISGTLLILQSTYWPHTFIYMPLQVQQYTPFYSEVWRYKLNMNRRRE